VAQEKTKIEDYAFLSDTQTGALVSRDGCIDWLCFPRFDSPACFASLLGDTKNGHWRFFPEEKIEETRRRYRGDSLILETEIETTNGAVRLIDFMPPRGENPDIIRIIEGLRGKVPMQLELIIRFDYGQIVPWVRKGHGGLEAIAGPDGLILRTPIETRGRDLTTVAEFTVSEGEKVPFVLTWFASHKNPPRAIHPDHALRDTEKYWRAWSEQFRGQGEWRDAVMRSLIVLKGLTYAPTGGLVAAATTSLPEQIGGPRNWDYRYCWLRDATFALLSLLRGSQILAGMAFAGRRWKPGADADHVRCSWRTPARRTRNSMALRVRRVRARAHWQCRFQSISAGCLWRGAGSHVAGGSLGNQIGRTRLGPDGPANEIPGIKLAETRRRNLGSAWWTKKFHALESDGVAGIRSRSKTC